MTDREVSTHIGKDIDLSMDHVNHRGISYELLNVKRYIEARCTEGNFRAIQIYTAISQHGYTHKTELDAGGMLQLLSDVVLSRPVRFM